MHDHEIDEEPRSRFPGVLIAVGMAAILFALFIGQQVPPQGDASAPTVLKNIRPAPDLWVEGWLNGEPPTPQSMNDKVIVLEAFATWCGPCREFIPELAQLEQKFRDRGVIFLSITREEGDMLSELEEFAKETGMTWRIGYGGERVLRDLDAKYIPATYIISREGQIVWTNNSSGSLEEAIEKTLEFTAAPESPAESTPASTADRPAEANTKP